MKPIFKNSAIAILVALGLSGCLSTGSSGNSTPATTTAISGTGTGSSAGTTTDSGSASTGTSTDSGSTSSGTTTDSGSTSNGTSTGSGSASTGSGSTSTGTSTDSGSTSNTAYKYSDNIKNKEGNEWRLVDTSIKRQGYLAQEGYELNVTPVDYLGHFNASLEVNFNKLSNNQLGKFSGTTEGEFLLGSNSSPSNKLDYTFVNQPYSTYGVVTDANGYVETFAIIQRTAKSSSVEGVYGITLVSNISEYEANPKGSATYTGNAFANVKYEDKDSRSYKNLAKEDGSFTLTADFDKSTVSGTLNSDTLGEIKLIKSNLGSQFSTGSQSAYVGDREGSYNVHLGGKDLNDVVGYVSFGYLSDKTITIDGKDQKIESYNAAFGGTKQ